MFKIFGATVRNFVAHNLCTPSEIHALLLKVVGFVPRSLMVTKPVDTIVTAEAVWVKVSLERCPTTPPKGRHNSADRHIHKNLKPHKLFSFSIQITKSAINITYLYCTAHLQPPGGDKSYLSLKTMNV